MVDILDSDLPSPWADDGEPGRPASGYWDWRGRGNYEPGPDDSGNKEWNRTWGKLCDKRYSFENRIRFRKDVTPAQVKALIEQGADVNCIAVEDNKSYKVDVCPLYAARYGLEEDHPYYYIVADLLIQNGANMNFRDEADALTYHMQELAQYVADGVNWKIPDEKFQKNSDSLLREMTFFISRGADFRASAEDLFSYEFQSWHEVSIRENGYSYKKGRKQFEPVSNLAKIFLAYGATPPQKTWGLSKELKEIFANVDKSRAEGKILADKFLDEIELGIDTYYKKEGWSRKSTRAIKDPGTKRYIKALEELKTRPAGPTDKEKKDLRDVFNKADKKGKETLAKILSQTSKPRQAKAEQLWEDRKAYYRYKENQQRLKNR